MGSPNSFGYVALILFVPLAFAVFARFRPTLAAAGLALGGLMFLPERVAFDMKGMPAIGKEQITYLAILGGALMRCPRRLAAARIGTGLEAVVVILVVSGFITVATNTDPIVIGATFKPGLDFYGGTSMAVEDLLVYGLPFFLGRALFRTTRDVQDLLVLMVAAGLVYSVPIAWEIRMSPQLHAWTYGFHANPFVTAIRWGGYRPMVYMQSGIAVGIFMATTVLAAGILAKLRIRVLGIPAAWLALYLLVMLILCKSVAAMVWGIVFLPVLWLLSPAGLRGIAIAMCAFAVIYPTLRLSGLFPTDAVVEVARGLDADRAASLGYRFKNENLLLEKVRTRLLFGWGGWSRNWLYDEDGESITVPDGFWIIQFGSRGLVGLFSVFALYLVPVMLALSRVNRFRSRRERNLVLGLCFVVLVRACDQLPNGFYTSLLLLQAGALSSVARSALRARSEARQRSRRSPREAAPATASARTARAR